MAGSEIWFIGHLPPRMQARLYNAFGQLVYSVSDYQNDLEAASLASGCYFYSLQCGYGDPICWKLVVQH